MKIKDFLTRHKVWSAFSLVILLFVVFSVSAAISTNIRQGSQNVIPNPATQVITSDESLTKKAPEPATLVTDLVLNETLPFETVNQIDSVLPKGRTIVKQYGFNGTKSVTYRVTYKDSTEVGREKVSERVVTPAKNKIVLIGSYVFPTFKPSNITGGGYINTYGNYIPSPGTSSAGASAKCSDGTYSYSQSRRGTCSYHGGVSIWY
jgi:hypothetical protein